MDNTRNAKTVRFHGEVYEVIRAGTWAKFGPAVLLRLQPTKAPKWVKLADVQVLA